MLRACYDWRVLAALLALAIAVYLVAPGFVAVAVPLLLVAACPLWMLVMMAVMRTDAARPEDGATRPSIPDQPSTPD